MTGSNRFFRMCLVLAAALFCTVQIALAVEVKPALIYSTGGKFDGSFNQAAYQGAESWKAKTGGSYAEFEIANDIQSEQTLRKYARSGYNPIVAVGFNHASAIAKVAAEFPDVNFTLIDSVVDAPNVRSVVFREHEGAYLVGILAAMASKTNTIGFVGGMDIPLIRKFACGYKQGAASVSADVRVLQAMTGDTFLAWNDPLKGAEITRSQIAQGADVILHGAGSTGLGVLQAAADAGKLGIGVDANQNHLHPGYVLTSMLKRVDVAVESTFSDTQAGTWSAGVRSLGLAENGLGWALDDNNRALITADMKQNVEVARNAIVTGELRVHDYTSDSQCPL